MIKNSNNINVAIFSALKVSEISKVPVLLMANPGMGKSSTVEMFAEVRGYKLILLRGNSESAETILGYDVAPTDTSKSNSTKHLRPEWFEKIKEADARGEKCLLFLDEITTATEYVQSALLHLIFERKVGTEDIPESTLIVSAGNYANNLSNSMVMLPPLMNRFMIFNIIPKLDDLEVFLNKYDGAITGKKSNYKEEIKRVMETLDKQELTVDDETLDKAGEYIERAIRTTAKALWGGGKKVVDLQVTDLQNIYSDLENDAALPGFVTFRTLNYLRDVTVASFKCFGKAGITSDNYHTMVTGLVGLGVSRDPKNGEVKSTDVTTDFFQAMQGVAVEIEKMNNTKLPAYEKFFNEIAKNKTQYDVSDLTVVINKMKDLKNDPDLKDIERPLDYEVLKKIMDNLRDSAMKNASVTIERTKPVLEQLSVEKYNEIVGYWSFVADLVIELDSLIGSSKRSYKNDAISALKNLKDSLNKIGYKVKGVRKLITIEDPALGNIALDVKSF